MLGVRIGEVRSVLSSPVGGGGRGGGEAGLLSLYEEASAGPAPSNPAAGEPANPVTATTKALMYYGR